MAGYIILPGGCHLSSLPIMWTEIMVAVFYCLEGGVSE